MIFWNCKFNFVFHRFLIICLNDKSTTYFDIDFTYLHTQKKGGPFGCCRRRLAVYCMVFYLLLIPRWRLYQMIKNRWKTKFNLQFRKIMERWTQTDWWNYYLKFFCIEYLHDSSFQKELHNDLHVIFKLTWNLCI